MSYLAAEAGIRQFLDLGAGLPALQNTHEVAQAAAPESRVIYVDHDPLVLRYARTLLAGTTDEGVTAYLDADYSDPGQVISDARAILNLTRPVAVPSGSYLALYDGTTERQAYVSLREEYARSAGIPYHPRTPDEIRAAFDGLELIEPGCVPVTGWHPEPGQDDDPRPVSAYGGVARKPWCATRRGVSVPVARAAVPSAWCRLAGRRRAR